MATSCGILVHITQHLYELSVKLQARGLIT